MESTSGFSTNCRQCGQYYRIEPPTKSAARGFLSRLMGAGKETAGPVTSSRQPSMPLQVLGYSEEADLIAESKPNQNRSSPPQKSYRSVVCFDCQHPHKVSGLSTSSLCPNCGSYIDLRDVVIKDRTTQKIRTRGDVTVEKKGALLGTSITCGNLVVEGQVAGSIYASGEVAFRSSGKVLGEVRCSRLVVEKKVSVQFLQPVHVDTMEVHGIVSGRFEVKNRLLLSRRGHIAGTIQSPSIRMDAGSQLDATLEILPRPLPPIPAPLPPTNGSGTSPLPVTTAPAESLAQWASEPDSSSGGG